jgi:hypothetical protein
MESITALIDQIKFSNSLGRIGEFDSNQSDDDMVHGCRRVQMESQMAADGTDAVALDGCRRGLQPSAAI